jgi:hypothetical protein
MNVLSRHDVLSLAKVPSTVEKTKPRMVVLSGPKTACIVRKREKTVFMQFVPDLSSKKHVCV